ncbi:coiled-coil domain-containing protein 34 [Chanos chanos]|uniref:Coiled-coil domain-containing protein 34 n=1 Tax=Chanos chanos TaxID=29144 RepID=A0A6J2V4Y4_CHACN|nr:coiled-coil domain-containing protein 34 [Chanos chanos]
MTTPQPSTSKSFTSTPLKKSGRCSVPEVKSLDYDSAGESTYSLLSPIFHDSFDLSDDDHGAKEPQQIHVITNKISNVAISDDATPSSPGRNGMESSHMEGVQSGNESFAPNLSAWEHWVICKAKEERLKTQQKAVEQLKLQQMKEQQEREKQQKQVVTEVKIQEWLQRKREEEKKIKLCREQQKSEETLQKKQKQTDIERKSQEKYKEWLQKKKEEEIIKKLREKEDADRREQQEKERREKAEEKFKEWLRTVKDKRQTSVSSAGGYDNLHYPSPSFVNPIPWKPIHVPKPERVSKKKTGRRRPSSDHSNCQATSYVHYKPKGPDKRR